MAYGHLHCLCLLLLGAAGVRGRLSWTGAGPSGWTRSLSQQAQEECPDGCALEGCVFASTGGGYRCQVCSGSLLINKISGNCACPAGKWASGEGVCSDCAKGSYCPGGDYFLGSNPLSPLKGTADEGKLAPMAVPCPIGSSGQSMTTLGRRATSSRACVNLPGTFYVMGTNGIDQVTCPVNTYGPGLKKQRACVPCPTGYSTYGATGATSITQCVVPPGYFLKGPGQVAPCPRGEYKEGIGPDGSCTKCSVRGVTTATEASTSSSNCTRIAPGLYAAAMEGSTVTETKPCPQGYYCTGGAPAQPFTPESPNPDAAPGGGRRLSQWTGTIFACPYGMWTVDVGATSVEQCLTPPGHFTTEAGTFVCPPGSFRADWKPFGDATACTSCGEGVKAAATDRITVYSISTSLVDYTLPVASSDGDCYIMPGQGLIFMTLSKTWRARNCTANGYGVSNITYGLSSSACRDCPANMVASTSNAFPNSARYYVRDGDSEGFADERACVTIDGYGMVGRASQPCDTGFWNTRDNRDACKPCDWGYTTPGVGRGTAKSTCGVAAGFGWDATQKAVLPCPIGTYNNASFTFGNGTACRPCPTGLTTAAEGASSRDACNMCQLGWGGVGCAEQCGGEGVGNATYGNAGRSIDTDSNCTACTTQATGYSFPLGGSKNDLFVSPPISRVGANASTDCVAKWSQLIDGAWHIPMPDNDAYSENFYNVTSFSACVDLCNYDPCEFVTYDYLTTTCTRRNAVPPVFVGAPLIAFKNLPSGDVGTNPWSADGSVATTQGVPSPGPGLENRAKLVSTGIYTFYREELALQVGTQESPSSYGYNVTAGKGDQFLQNCLDACDNLSKCAGITIKMNVVVEDRPTTCKLIIGRIKLGVHKRTVMRAEPSRMPLPSLDDLPDPNLPP